MLLIEAIGISFSDNLALPSTTFVHVFGLFRSTILLYTFLMAVLTLGHLPREESMVNSLQENPVDSRASPWLFNRVAHPNDSLDVRPTLERISKVLS
jgi:hypothetical protein